MDEFSFFYDAVATTVLIAVSLIIYTALLVSAAYSWVMRRKRPYAHWDILAWFFEFVAMALVVMFVILKLSPEIDYSDNSDILTKWMLVLTSSYLFVNWSVRIIIMCQYPEVQFFSRFFSKIKKLNKI